jgi:hypothetical protein
MSGTLEHGEASERRQAPSDDEWWQDSAFVVWHADEAGIGGVIRIGHEPNHEGGLAALWFGLVTQDGARYRRNTTNRLGDGDRPADGFGALDGRYRLVYEDGLRMRVDDRDCSVDLAIEDFYPRTDFFPPTAGTLVDDFASSHFETSGRISGAVVLGDRSYEVEGLCHRDRSWGLRRWDTLLNHRWVPGTVGPELSFGSISWHGIDGTLRQFGYVVRDGAVVRAEAVDIVVAMEADGMSYRGGTATWRFADGEELVLDCVPVDGIVFEHHGVASVDGICAVEVEGRRGFCDLEVSTNPRAGSGPVTTAVRAANSDGLSRRRTPERGSDSPRTLVDAVADRLSG